MHTHTVNLAISSIRESEQTRGGFFDVALVSSFCHGGSTLPNTNNFLTCESDRLGIPGAEELLRKD